MQSTTQPCERSAREVRFNQLFVVFDQQGFACQQVCVVWPAVVLTVGPDAAASPTCWGWRTAAGKLMELSPDGLEFDTCPMSLSPDAAPLSRRPAVLLLLHGLCNPPD